MKRETSRADQDVHNYNPKYKIYFVRTLHGWLKHNVFKSLRVRIELILQLREKTHAKYAYLVGRQDNSIKIVR
jgi:hypothetical protein